MAGKPKTFSLVIDDKPAFPHNGAVPSLRVNGEGGQRRILRSCLENFIVVCAFGRSFGKTLTAFFLFWEELRLFGTTLWPGHKTYEFAYCAPTRINHAIKVYRQWKILLAPILSGHNDAELWLEVTTEGRKALLDFWGLDEYDAHRGARKHRIVVDECKDVDEQAFINTLLPMTLGRDGKMLLQGTPGRWGKGNKWFKGAFVLGQQRKDGYFSLTAPSHDNPFLKVEEINRLKAAAMAGDSGGGGGEKAVREEIYAEWLDDEGAVFSNLRATFALKPTQFFRWDKGTFRFIEEPEGGRVNLWILKDADSGEVMADSMRAPDKYIAALDFGIKDATVWTLFNRRTNEQEAVARFPGSDDYTDIIPAIDRLMDWWNGPLVIYDAGGGHGGAIREHLVRHFQQGIHGRRWNHQGKVADISRAQMLCSKAGTDDGWLLLNVPWQRAEFEDYSVETITKSGQKLTHPRFGPKAGGNDDSVTAACLAATMLSSEYRAIIKKRDPPMWSKPWLDAYAKGMANARRVLGRGR